MSISRYVARSGDELHTGEDSMDGRHGGFVAALEWRTVRWWNVLVAVTALTILVGIYPVNAALVRGGDGNDILWGRDNDNAANAFIQPAGVSAKQHMDNTDVLLGSGNGDVMIGKKGNDVIDGASGDDILIGGVENFVAPNSDVLIGGTENDINIWAPGDGSDLFAGDTGTDIQIFAPFVLKNGQPQLFLAAAYNRVVPHVDIDSKPQFSCEIEAAPSNLGVQFVSRFLVNGTLAVTVRLRDVELVLCPSPNANAVLVADLKSGAPTVFVERPLSTYSNTLLGAILQAP
jgi:hypothetical protein